MRKSNLDSIEDIVKSEKRESYREGIHEGLAIAERIFRHWSENHKLVDPHSIEKLTQWSENALHELKERLA